MAEKDYDIILLYSLKAGNAVALDLLFQKYYNRLCNYVYSYVKEHALAEDIITELFADLWIKRNKINVKSNAQGYLYAIAKNAALGYLRKKRLTVVGFDDLPELHVATGQTPFTKYNHKETSGKIAAILEKIPTRSRQVFMLHRFDEMKYKEIAEVLEISIKTVENHMNKALKILHENIDLINQLLKFLVVFFTVNL